MHIASPGVISWNLNETDALDFDAWFGGEPNSPVEDCAAMSLPLYG